MTDIATPGPSMRTLSIRHAALLRRFTAGGLGLFAMIGILASLGGCGRKPPLSAELAAIQCPADQAGHASAMFGKAQVTFVCINKKLADTPALLRCDLESRPMVCEDSGMIRLSRGDDGKVYASQMPPGMKLDGQPTTSPLAAPSLEVHFHAGEPRTPTFDEKETDWKFILPDAKLYLPAGFTFVKGALCDNEATVLNNGMCVMEARTASLYWHISVSLPRKSGTPITADEYRSEFESWLKYLGKLVVDPKS